MLNKAQNPVKPIYGVRSQKEGFPGSSLVESLPVGAGDGRDSGSIPRLGRSPREGDGNLLQYSCLRNPMARGAW